MIDSSLDLFQAGDFTAHSGASLSFKVECDALAESELDLFAQLIVTRLYKDVEFGRVTGVPKARLDGRDNGGVLAQYVRRHIRAGRGFIEDGTTLIVDDVLTTGGSMWKTAAGYGGYGILGAVIFARGPCPEWVRPLFTLNKLVW